MTERPVFSECVIGYRSWKLDDWVLSPVRFGSPWRPGINHAKCKRDDTGGLFATTTFSLSTAGFTAEPAEPPTTHAAPHQNCTCGLHAYHDIPDIAEGVVVGAVAAWGDLQVHCNGFRAEYAQIVALVEAPGLDEVAGLYGVPLVARSVLEAEASQHGTPLPASLRPPKPPVGMPFTLRASLYSQMLYGAGGVSGSGYTSGGVVYKSSTRHTDIWTPADDKDVDADDVLSRYRKPPANRQGPAKPKRPPRRLGA